MILDNYKIYKSDTVLENSIVTKENCLFADKIWEETIKSDSHQNSTWSYQDYNIFSIASGSTWFYNVYKEICECYRDFSGHTGPAWLVAWLNSHDKDSVLDWHGHSGTQFHGYIVMDDHDLIKTRTVFRNYEIHNEYANIYVGKGMFDHQVVVDEPYEGVRHTLAYQISRQEYPGHRSSIPVA